MNKSSLIKEENKTISIISETETEVTPTDTDTDTDTEDISEPILYIFKIKVLLQSVIKLKNEVDVPFELTFYHERIPPGIYYLQFSDVQPNTCQIS